jgi:hypothetical protein
MYNILQKCTDILTLFEALSGVFFLNSKKITERSNTFTNTAIY